MPVVRAWPHMLLRGTPRERDRSVIALGGRARNMADAGTPIAMERYWPSTLAYARAGGVEFNLDALARPAPEPDVS